MLILQRKPGESLLIGQDIQISVLSIDSGGRVRLAIDAPKSYAILRSELICAVGANQEAAHETLAPDELLHLLGGVLGKEEKETL